MSSKPSDEAADADTTDSPDTSSGNLLLTAIIVVLLLFFMSVILLNVIWDRPFPTYPALLLFGLVVACVSYGFLDPDSENKMTIGAISLGGSAVVVMAFAWLLGDKIDAQMNGPLDLKEARKDLKTANDDKDNLNKIIDDRDSTIKVQTTKLAQLRADAGKSGPVTDSEVTTKVREAGPRTDLGKSIISLRDNKLGPFRPDPTLTVAFNGSVPKGTFEYCHSNPKKLDQRIELFLNDKNDRSRKFQADPGENFGCGTTIDYDVKLGCDALEALMIPEDVGSCDEKNIIRWTTEKKTKDRRWAIDWSAIAAAAPPTQTPDQPES